MRYSPFPPVLLKISPPLKIQKGLHIWEIQDLYNTVVFKIHIKYPHYNQLRRTIDPFEFRAILYYLFIIISRIYDNQAIVGIEFPLRKSFTVLSTTFFPYSSINEHLGQTNAHTALFVFQCIN